MPNTQTVKNHVAMKQLLRRGTEAMWEEANPILLAGEWGLVVTSLTIGEDGKEVVTYDHNEAGEATIKYKIGDGETAWTDLPYVAFGEGDTGGGTDPLPFPISDSVKTTDSFTAASSTAVKTAYDKAEEALATANQASEKAPDSFTWRDVPITLEELNGITTEALPSGAYFLKEEDALAVGLPSACFITHYNREGVGREITQKAVEVFSTSSTTMMHIWIRQYSESTKWTSWQHGGIEVPKGIICMWSGAIANIPFGYALCNGTKGTPDLRDRFVICAGGKYAVGAQGGSETHGHTITVNAHTLTVGQMPSHSHTVGISTRKPSDATAGNGAVQGVMGMINEHKASGVEGGSQAHTHGASASTSSNLGPYYALAYIMKI